MSETWEKSNDLRKAKEKKEKKEKEEKEEEKNAEKQTRRVARVTGSNPGVRFGTVPTYEIREKYSPGVIRGDKSIGDNGLATAHWYPFESQFGGAKHNVNRAVYDLDVHIWIYSRFNNVINICGTFFCSIVAGAAIYLNLQSIKIS